MTRGCVWCVCERERRREKIEREREYLCDHLIASLCRVLPEIEVQLVPRELTEPLESEETQVSAELRERRDLRFVKNEIVTNTAPVLMLIEYYTYN